jgi:hypothetical protein
MQQYNQRHMGHMRTAAAAVLLASSGAHACSSSSNNSSAGVSRVHVCNTYWLQAKAQANNSSCACGSRCHAAVEWTVMLQQQHHAARAQHDLPQRCVSCHVVTTRCQYSVLKIPGCDVAKLHLRTSL